jgi:hypothetical protein
MAATGHIGYGSHKFAYWVLTGSARLEVDKSWAIGGGDANR